MIRSVEDRVRPACPRAFYSTNLLMIVYWFYQNNGTIQLLDVYVSVNGNVYSHSLAAKNSVL